MWKSSQKPFLSAEEIENLKFQIRFIHGMKLRWKNHFSCAKDWHQEHSKICVNFCDHKLIYTKFTVTFCVFTFLLSCCMGFISAILEIGFNVLCSFRCSSRSVVLLEIYCSFCQVKRLDLWFMMKAAFSQGWGDTASPPFPLAFKECLETSPDEWWAGTGAEGHLQWRNSVPQWWWGWCAGKATGQERLSLWGRHEQMKKDTMCPHLRFGSLVSVSHCLSGLGSLTLPCSISANCFKSLLILISLWR